MVKCLALLLFIQEIIGIHAKEKWIRKSCISKGFIEFWKEDRSFQMIYSSIILICVLL